MQKIRRAQLLPTRNRSCLERILQSTKSGYRHYDPETGRWLQKDPILFGNEIPGLAQPPKPTTTQDVNLIFVSTVRDVTCIDLQTGKSIWHYAPYADDGNEYIYSSPSLEADTVVYGDNDGNDGNVRCLSASTGKLVWQTAVEPDHWIVSSPLIANGKIYAVSNKGKLAALNLQDGKVLWSVSLPEGSIRGLSFVGGELLIPGSTSLMFVDGSGKLLHRIEFDKLFYSAVVGKTVYCAYWPKGVR